MNRLSSKLAARAGTRQLELLARADDASDAADAAVVAAWSELLALLQQPGHVSLRWRTLHAAITKLVTAPHAVLRDRLTDLAQFGHQSGAGVLVQTLPLEYLQHAANRNGVMQSGAAGYNNAVTVPVAGHWGRVTESTQSNRRLREDAGSVRLGVAGGRLSAQGQFPSEPARARLTDAELRARFEQLLFAPPSVAQVADILRRPLNGQSWEQDLGQASKLAGFDPHHMASTIAIAFSAGKNVREIAKELEPVVNGVKSSARRIGRTYGMQVAHHAQMQAHEAVDDLIVGYQVHALLDHNTRPWHAKRSGTIYYKNPKPDQKGFAQMPNPPLEPEDPRERPPGTPRMAWNCRCSLRPVLAEIPALTNAPEFVNNAHKVIPDPTTYRDWWRQVDDRRRKLAVGARRFAIVADDGPPRWEDFVDPKTGNLLTAAQLQRETSAERYARVQEVQKQIAKARQAIRQVSTFGFSPGRPVPLGR